MKVISFSQTSYAQINHLTAQPDDYFIEKILFPELKQQSRFASVSKGINIRGTDEYLSISEVRQLILDYLIQNQNLQTVYQEDLKKIKGIEEFCDRAYFLYQGHIKTPTSLVTAQRLQQAEALQNSNQIGAVHDRQRFNSDQTIREYNALYNKILQYSGYDDAKVILQRLFPSGITTSTDVREYSLAQVIAENLVKLHSAGSLGTSEDAKNQAVANELRSIIAIKHPQLNPYLNLLGGDQTKRDLKQLADVIYNHAYQDNKDFAREYERLQNAVAQTLDRHLLNETELREQLVKILPTPKTEERERLADAILHGMVRGSGNLQDIRGIVNQLNLSDSQKNELVTKIEQAGLDVSLQHRQAQLYVLSETQRLSGNKSLINAGINPYLISPYKLFENKEKELFQEYVAKTGHQFANLQEAYDYERGQSNPDTAFLDKARDYYNRVNYYGFLSQREKTRVGRTQFIRNLNSARRRIYELQNKFTDKWINLEETITGRRWFYKQLDKWDRFAEHFTIPFGKNKIPIFRLRNWAFDQFDLWKQRTTLSAISKTSNWKGFGRFIHLRLKDYELGGFTLRGATFVGTYRLWSKAVYIASSRIVKEGVIFSARSATRLLIKLGGKTLARAGGDIIAGLAGLGTGIGIVLTIATILDLGFMFLKGIFSGLKRLIPNTDALLAGIVTSAAAAGTATLGFFVSLLNPLVLPTVVTIGLVFGITFGSIGLMNLYNAALKANINLDSGYQQFVASIVCNQDGKSTGNPTANAAVCIAKVLNDCSLNPLFGRSIATGNWKCVVTSLLLPGAVDQLTRSAKYVGDGWTPDPHLQCVGLAAAAAGSGFPQTDACNYADPNYKVSGWNLSQQCRPGSLFVDAHSCPGHIGVVINCDAGAVVKCVDANLTGPGKVRNEQECSYEKGKISGYLNKI